jgi:type VI secretion system secreted protein VgrG
MMADGSVSQATRLGKFRCPLGDDALVLMRFQGEEGINRLGSFEVEVMSPGRAVDLNALLGLHGTVLLNTLQHGPRHFDGIMTEAEVVGERLGDWLYRLTLRPWFWLTDLRKNQRIFHAKTAPQIISAVLAEHGFVHDPRLTQSYEPIEYVVQYDETDFAFVCRMMERAGISYHFEHVLQDHQMILTDTIEEFKVAPGAQRIFEPVEGQHRTTEEHFNMFSAGRQITTGRVKLTDYNFKTPTAAMVTDASGDAAHAKGDIESYEYPGDYLSQPTGRPVVRLRADQARATDGLFTARGDTASLAPGMRVGLKKHPDTALNNKNYLLVSAKHSYTAEKYKSGEPEGTPGDAYSGDFVFHPEAKPFVPQRITPFARVQGPQTAVVVGQGEIDCDEFGRILVRFHWDLNAEISMRCRVSQNWAGNGWGGMVIPRIGMEVLVEFLEGDPDKPLVTGCVYNGRNRVPYGLPENKTRSTFKTNTHQGEGYNELRFEDANGEEEVFMHAQKDHNTVIENDETHMIGHDRTKTVGNDQAEAVGHDKTISVANDHTETIGRDMTYKVGRNQIENYGKDHIHRVGNIHKQAIFADHLYEVGRNYEGEVAGKYTLDVGASITNNTAKHTLMAFEKMQVKGPGGKITIDASGITLEAATIFLKGNVIMGGSGSAQVPTLQLAANEGLPLCEECPPPEKA